MPDIADTIDGHRQLAATVATMVVTARARNWRPLAALDARCAELFDALRRMAPQALSPDERLQLLTLAQQIRAGQQELEDLLRPQFLQLAASVAQLHRAQAPQP